MMKKCCIATSDMGFGTSARLKYPNVAKYLSGAGLFWFWSLDNTFLGK